MKYSEYLQLNKKLEEQGTTLFEELGLNNNLNEEDDIDDISSTSTKGVETKKGNIFTKWGRIKRALNREAKRMQKNTIKQIDKYLPKILENERKLAAQIIKLRGENVESSKIIEYLKPKTRKLAAFEEKQLSSLGNLIDRQLTNATRTFKDKIDSSEKSKTITQLLDVTTAFFKGGAENAALKLKNYWEVLRTQVTVNVYGHISNRIRNEINETITDPELRKIFDELSPALSILGETITTKKSESEKTINNFKDDEREAKEEGETGLKKGKIYYYKEDIEHDRDTVVTITDIDDEYIHFKNNRTDELKKVSIDQADRFKEAEGMR